MNKLYIGDLVKDTSHNKYLKIVFNEVKWILFITTYINNNEIGLMNTSFHESKSLCIISL